MKRILPFLIFLGLSVNTYPEETIKQIDLKDGDVFIHKLDKDIKTSKTKIPVIKYREGKTQKKISNSELKLVKKYAPELIGKKQSLDRFMFLNKLRSFPKKYFLRDYPNFSSKKYDQMKRELASEN